MKIAVKAFAVLILLLLSMTNSGQTQTWGQPVWADEFHGAANSPIDSSKWTFDTGNLKVNNELEIYCSPSMNTMGCDPNSPNAFIDGNDHLVIQQRLANSIWTSARLKTQGLKTFQFGRIEASMQFPSHQGLWPAFWMLGNNIDSVGWPNCGEVDIMENWPGIGASKNATTMHGDTYHGANGLNSVFTFPNGERVDTAFHTYGIIWSKNMMQFYFDDPENITFVRTAADVPAGGTWPFNNPFFLIMNMAVGGDLGQTPDAGTPTATPSMALDYVRYYQASLMSGPTMTQTNGITVNAGGSGSTMVNLSSAIGSGLVYLMCTNAPAKATCSIDTTNTINTHVADFRANPVDQATVHVTTTANTASSYAPLRVAWATLLSAFVLFPAVSKKVSSRLVLIGGMLIILISAAAFQSCGGGSGTTGGGGGGGGTNGTPTGHYTLTITAYTVSGDTSTANVTLNVN